MYTAKVKRPYPSKDEQGNLVKDANGNQVYNPNWTSIGRAFATQSGKGFSLRLDFQPIVTDGSVEEIFIFPVEKKEQANG
jgi:hypothetical protein